MLVEIEADAEEVQKRIDGYDPYHCGPQYLAGLRGGYYESIKKIKDKFGMRI